MTNVIHVTKAWQVKDAKNGKIHWAYGGDGLYWSWLFTMSPLYASQPTLNPEWMLEGSLKQVVITTTVGGVEDESIPTRED